MPKSQKIQSIAQELMNITERIMDIREEMLPIGQNNGRVDYEYER